MFSPQYNLTSTPIFSLGDQIAVRWRTICTISTIYLPQNSTSFVWHVFYLLRKMLCFISQRYMLKMSIFYLITGTLFDKCLRNRIWIRRSFGETASIDDSAYILFQNRSPDFEQSENQNENLWKAQSDTWRTNSQSEDGSQKMPLEKIEHLLMNYVIFNA